MYVQNQNDIVEEKKMLISKFRCELSDEPRNVLWKWESRESLWNQSLIYAPFQ